MSGESSGRVASCENGGVSSSIGLISKAQTATAEILWALHAVNHNYSVSLLHEPEQQTEQKYVF